MHQLHSRPVGPGTFPGLIAFMPEHSIKSVTCRFVDWDVRISSQSAIFRVKDSDKSLRFVFELSQPPRKGEQQ